MNRRQVCAAVGTALAAAAVPLWAEIAKLKRVASSLVPAMPGSAPNYWCTWAAQNYMYGRGAKEFNVEVVEGDAGADIARNAINEEALLGTEGWAKVFYPQIRKDLYLLLDDGWEEDGSASLLLDGERFPSFTGTPQARLRKLNDAIGAKGWRGLALRCRNTPDIKGIDRLVAWSKEAGIQYWKIDGGDQTLSVDRARDAQRAPLTIEHVFGDGPLNGNWPRDGRFGEQKWDSSCITILRQTDVYSTCDTTALLSIPTTLDRVSELLRGATGHSETRGILNVEDEVYIAAVLGCAMGVLRNPLQGERPGTDVDLFFAGPRHLKRCMDEVTRAVRWQRLAAPYAADSGFVRLDQAVLTDEWIFNHGETWFIEAIGRRANQGAPARIGRNLELPKVTCTGRNPFVFTARFPNGAAAIGSHGRMSTYWGWWVPRAEVYWQVGNCTGPFGLFGYFNSVTLAFDKPVGKVQILAQDLASDRAFDITQLVEIHGPEIVVPGEVISHIGLDGATPGDMSAPGLLVELSSSIS